MAQRLLLSRFSISPRIICNLRINCSFHSQCIAGNVSWAMGDCWGTEMKLQGEEAWDETLPCATFWRLQWQSSPSHVGPFHWMMHLFCTLSSVTRWVTHALFTVDIWLTGEPRGPGASVHSLPVPGDKPEAFSQRRKLPAKDDKVLSPNPKPVQWCSYKGFARASSIFSIYHSPIGDHWAAESHSPMDRAPYRAQRSPSCFKSHSDLASFHIVPKMRACSYQNPKRLMIHYLSFLVIIRVIQQCFLDLGRDAKRCPTYYTRLPGPGVLVGFISQLQVHMLPSF